MYELEHKLLPCPLMEILFIHQNFPGQFRHLAPALVQRGHQVTALCMKKECPATWNGVRMLSYSVARGSTKGIHPWVGDFETKVIRGEACFRAALRLRDQEGYSPDLIIAHPGWGESLFLKDVWPKAKLAIYCEFFYSPEGADVGFDPEFPHEDAGYRCRLRMKNSNSLLHFDVADAAISPTAWQASTFPEPFRSRITVVHDGIDTATLTPDPDVTLTLRTKAGVKIRLTRHDELITFVNRNLEPYRGYHIFMRSLPELLRRRPNARVLIVGGSEVSYGARPKHGESWKHIFIDEVRPLISDADWQRVHFLGKVPYVEFVKLLQLSTVHLYLTYPFVLSWSLLEAMSAGCTVLASDTPPLREVITHNHNGWLVDFFDPNAIVDKLSSLCDDPDLRERLGSAARAFAVEHYDLKTICLPRQLEWVDSLLQP